MPTHNFAASTLCLTSLLELFKIELAPKKTTLRVAGAGFVHTRYNDRLTAFDPGQPG